MALPVIREEIRKETKGKKLQYYIYYIILYRNFYNFYINITNGKLFQNSCDNVEIRKLGGVR